jgi:hypothetical protein
MRTGAKNRENRAQNRFIVRNSHATRRKKLLRWVIPDGQCAQGGTFLAAFTPNGVARVVYPSAECNHSGERLRACATTRADIPGPVTTLEANLFPTLSAKEADRMVQPFSC